MKVEKDVSLAGPVDSKPILSDRKGSLKVTITPAQHKTLTHLPKRPPVDLAFTDLTYRVHEGKRSSKYFLHFNFYFCNCQSYLPFILLLVLQISLYIV